MRIILTAVAFLAALLAAHTALLADDEGSAGLQPTMSWYGNTGLIRTPSAYTGGASSFSAAWHEIQLDEEDVDDLSLANLNVSIKSMFEIGGSWLDGEGIDSELVGNAKVVVPIGTWLGNTRLPAVAIGGIDVSDEVNRTFYVVMSKMLPGGPEGPPRVCLHLGYGDNDANEGALDGFFGGLEWGVLDDVVLTAEHDGDDFNTDLRWRFTDGFTADVGIIDGELGLGLMYSRTR